MTTPPLSLDDNATIQAIGILADVLDAVSGPGVLDTVLVSKALRQVMATRSQPAFDFATRAFSTLDPSLKRRVAEDADNAARDAAELRQRVAGFLNTAPRKPVASPAPPPAPQASPPSPPVQGAGLLGALNTRGRGPAPGGGGRERE